MDASHYYFGKWYNLQVYAKGVHFCHAQACLPRENAYHMPPQGD